MRDVDKILDEIVEAWRESATNTIVNMVQSHPDEEYYAAAFWLFYVDYTIIVPPAFAMNSEAFVSEEEAGSTNRWDPANWNLKWFVLKDTMEPLKPVYKRLSDHMEGASDEEWDSLIERHFSLMAELCRELTTSVHQEEGQFSGVTLPSDFVVAILEARDSLHRYNELAYASIEPTLLERLNGLIISQDRLEDELRSWERERSK